MSRVPHVTLSKDLRRAVRRGHPWIYGRALTRDRPAVTPGQLVAVRYDGEDIAVGFADPDRAIAVRIIDRLTAPRSVDENFYGGAWARERARRAAHLRRADPRLARTDAVRLIHGENDFMPGLVIDLYGDTAVAVFDGGAAEAFWTPHITDVTEGLREHWTIARVWARPLKSDANRRSQQGRALIGDEPPELIVIDERGARFEVDVRRGQKTGLFLDQRRNRARVGELAAGADVLNLFCYTGGFSVHAALGGARRVTSVDISRPAIAAAERNFRLNGLDPADHAFVAEDAFAYLTRRSRRGQRVDIAIIDPPSFAPNERSRPQALDAYRTLNRLGLGLIQPGGWLISASCSSHVTRADMLAIIAAASAQAGRRTRIVEARGADSDHPILPAFPEGEYLKFLVVHVD